MPLWQELSLREHALYVGKALALMDKAQAPCPRLAMQLQLALGSLVYHAVGGAVQSGTAFAEAARLAERSQDLGGQLRAISGQMAVDLCGGRYDQARAQSVQFDRLDPRTDPLLGLSNQRLQALAQHFTGDQVLARQNAEQLIQRMAHSGHLNRFAHGIGIQYDQNVASLTVLARILWLQGYPGARLAHRQPGIGTGRAGQPRHLDLLHPGPGRRGDRTLQRRPDGSAAPASAIAGTVA